MTTIAQAAEARVPLPAAGQPPLLVPIRTVPGPNAREHFRVRAKRVKQEREATAWVLRNAEKPPLPCSVLLTRVSPGTNPMDDDNLPASLKSVRDEIAKWLGVDDRHSLTVRYRYAQARGPWGVRIAFGEAVSGAQESLWPTL